MTQFTKAKSIEKKTNMHEGTYHVVTYREISLCYLIYTVCDHTDRPVTLLDQRLVASM